MLLTEIAIAAIPKYATRDGGDVADIVAVPSGGVAAVLVDGQGSGPAARSLAMLVSNRVLSLLRDGVRDDVAAQATADFLHSHRRGQVSTTLNVVAIGPDSSSITVTRYDPTPYLFGTRGSLRRFGTGSEPMGPHRSPTMVREQHAMVSGCRLMFVTDGVASAGVVRETAFDLLAWANSAENELMAAAELAEGLLVAAIDADRGRPRDDMTVLAVCTEEVGTARSHRRIVVSLPPS